MRHILLILATFLVLVGCMSQKKCLERYPPSVEVTDSIYIKDTMWIEKDTIVFEKDSVVIIDSVWCKGDTVYLKSNSVSSSGNRTTASASVSNNKLTVKCSSDSLSKVIDGLTVKVREIARSKIRVDVVDRPVEVIKFRIPRWVWLLLLINSVQIIWNTRKYWLKFFTFGI